MKMMKTLYAGAALLIAATMAVPAAAQEWPTKPGSVWVASRVDVMPGQLPAYLDYLATEWKKEMEWRKADGHVLSYRIFDTLNERGGDPDIVLLIEYKDYFSLAQRAEINKRFNAWSGTDARQRATGSAVREKIRTDMGSTQYQELILK